jgi:acetate kinase
MSTSKATRREVEVAQNLPDHSCLLTVNGGSSSLKFALFERPSSRSSLPARVLSGRIERIGLENARMAVGLDGAGDPKKSPVTAPSPAAAADRVLEWLDENVGREAIAGVGFRIVHGGARYHRPERITTDLLAELRRLIPLDVDHLPGEIALIERFQQHWPGLALVACFDTAFHHDLPRVAQIIPIARRFASSGVRRYGFHGLSYTYLMEELARLAGPETARGRLILAHLGSGASMAAVKEGHCIDTTMGFTPAAGLVMSTRSGDIDPGLPLFLSQSAGLTAEKFHKLVNHESGLLGVSEISPDIRDLLAKRDQDPRVAEALALFEYSAKKAIGAFAAALGGLDVLVFSGGIGENSPEARAGICDGLSFLGIQIDESRNRANAPLISTEGARTPVRVIPTDEESMIARETEALLRRSQQIV